MTASDEAALSISGKEIKYDYQLLDINEVHFYPKNPRVASLLPQDKNITDEEIDKILWDNNSTHTLCMKIKEDGGLIHPILVYKNEVLEGNTRLCCYRHLFLQEKDEKWKKIRCQVIIDPLNQMEIYRLLCTEHIEGKTPWEAYEKANLYKKMQDEEGMTIEQITKIVGESHVTVRNRINAINMMINNDVKDKNKYSHFEQLVGNDQLKEIRREEPEVENVIIDLIKQEKIPNAQDIRKIPDIYKHRDARRRLLIDKEDIQQVFFDLKAKAPMTDSAIMKDIEKIIKKIKGLTREEREGIKKNKRDSAKVEQLASELVKLCKELDIKVYVPKDLRKN